MFMFDTFFILICFQVLFILKDLLLLPHFSSSKPQGKVKESKKKHGKAWMSVKKRTHYQGSKKETCLQRGNLAILF